MRVPVAAECDGRPAGAAAARGHRARAVRGRARRQRRGRSGAAQAAALLLAVVSGAIIGGFLVGIGRLPAGGRLWPLAIARAAGTLTIAAAALVRREPPRVPSNAWAPILGCALFDDHGERVLPLRRRRRAARLVATIVSRAPEHGAAPRAARAAERLSVRQRRASRSRSPRSCCSLNPADGAPEARVNSFDRSAHFPETRAPCPFAALLGLFPSRAPRTTRRRGRHAVGANPPQASAARADRARPGPGARAGRSRASRRTARTTRVSSSTSRRRGGTSRSSTASPFAWGSRRSAACSGGAAWIPSAPASGCAARLQLFTVAHEMTHLLRARGLVPTRGSGSATCTRSRARRT